MLSKDELELYQRQLLIAGWNIETQNQFKNKNIFIAGAGGLASPCSIYLTVAGIGKITICDFDKVSLSNLNRQILHPYEHLNLKKVDSAYITLSKLNPNVKIEIIDKKITKNNISNLIENSDLVIDCLDNFESRHILNKACVNMNKILVHAGVEGFSGQLTVIKPHETPCLACFLPKKSNKKPVPIIGATTGIIGCLEAMEAIKVLTGIGKPLYNRILFFNGLDMSFKTIKIDKNKKCKVCN